MALMRHNPFPTLTTSRPDCVYSRIRSIAYSVNQPLVPGLPL